tara:strand:+ start:78 stop:305 length:228 start_codon:yes stop_codon:yes gene_type:complete
MVNGWTNRETWLVNVHFGDDWKSAQDVNETKEWIEYAWGSVDCLPSKPFFNDYINFGLINWDELLNIFEEEESSP